MDDQELREILCLILKSQKVILESLVGPDKAFIREISEKIDDIGVKLGN